MESKRNEKSLERERCDLARGKFKHKCTQYTAHAHAHTRRYLLTHNDSTHLHDRKIYGMHFVIKSVLNVRKCKMFGSYLLVAVCYLLFCWLGSMVTTTTTTYQKQEIRAKE